MKLTRSVISLLFICTAGLCAAKPPFLRVFLATYGINPDSKLAQNRCLNCHQPPGPPHLNPYGKTVQAAMESAGARMLTADILRTVEHKNAGDGVPFLSKIKADFPPGQLKPKKKPASKKPGKKRAELPVSGLALIAVGGLGSLLSLSLGRASSLASLDRSAPE